MRASLLLPLCAVAAACQHRALPVDAGGSVEPGTSVASPAVPTAPPASAALPAPPTPSPAPTPAPPASASGKAAPGAFERRCGWVDNPTPGNWWITDRDGEWEIGVQGGYQAEGDLPDFGARWVETNGHHGYGCACMDVRVDRATKRVLVVRDVTVLPIARCRKDKTLPRR